LRVSASDQQSKKHQRNCQVDGGNHSERLLETHVPHEPNDKRRVGCTSGAQQGGQCTKSTGRAMKLPCSARLKARRQAAAASQR
jgi:hypothetical protein